MFLRTAALCGGFVLTSAVRLAIGPAGIDQQSAREAPAGFDTPSFNGGQSVSNGIAEPPGDSFALDQQVYELNHSVQTGLGPVYNATACGSCHENPNPRGSRKSGHIGSGENRP